MNTPFFSIVIPIYNREDLIESTVRSVLTQKFESYEVVLVDDGSKDNTKEVIRQHFKDEPKVRYFWKENGERGAARNYGLKKANGKYVVFFDSDDLMYDHHLSTLYEGIQKYPNVGFFAAKFNYTLNGKEQNADIPDFKDGLYDYNTFINGNGLACNFCVKKDNPDLHLFIEDRYFSVMEDWMFLVQNLEKGQIYIMETLTISMRAHDGRSMHEDFQKIIQKKLTATKWLEEHVSLNQQQKNILWAHCYHFCAVHNYIDYNRKSAFDYLLKAYQKVGYTKKYRDLFLKIVLGRKNILRIQRLIWS